MRSLSYGLSCRAELFEVFQKISTAGERPVGVMSLNQSEAEAVVLEFLCKGGSKVKVELGSLVISMYIEFRELISFFSFP